MATDAEDAHVATVGLWARHERDVMKITKDCDAKKGNGDEKLSDKKKEKVTHNLLATDAEDAHVGLFARHERDVMKITKDCDAKKGNGYEKLSDKLNRR